MHLKIRMWQLLTMHSVNGYSGRGIRMIGHVNNKRYRTFDEFLKEKLGVKVRKISVDAGFTCPNRDGKVGRSGCIYCCAPAFTPSSGNRRKSIRAQVEEGKSRLRKRRFKGKFLVYFQAYSNTYAPVSILKTLYDEALTVEDIVGLAIGTRPDLCSQ